MRAFSSRRHLHRDGIHCDGIHCGCIFITTEIFIATDNFSATDVFSATDISATDISATDVSATTFLPPARRQRRPFRARWRSFLSVIFAKKALPPCWRFARFSPR